MANVKIEAAVGVRNGKTMPNKKADLDKITGLFDSIPAAQGGTRGTWRSWMQQRDFLIIDVTEQIIVFQTVNNLPTIDGVVDPGGSTLQLLNYLAGPGRAITATVAPIPAGYAAEGNNVAFPVVSVDSMPGTAPLRQINAAASYVRRLIRVEGTSIQWFGVFFPRYPGGIAFGTVPHIFFTPLPHQGGYEDPSYASFATWGKLWHDYTWGMGRHIAGSGADHILVIPFYRNSQHGNLGDFLFNWKETIKAVVNVAINSVDVTELRDEFTFDRICSSSFSNGWIPHHQFNTTATAQPL